MFLGGLLHTVQTLSNQFPEIGVNLREVLHGAILEEGLCGLAQAPDDVVHKSLPCRFVKDFGPEQSHLAKVVVISRVVALHVPRHLVRGHISILSDLESTEAVREVVWSSALFLVMIGESVPDCVTGTDLVRGVDRELGVVWPETVTVGVSV